MSNKNVDLANTEPHFRQVFDPHVMSENMRGNYAGNAKRPSNKGHNIFAHPDELQHRAKRTLMVAAAVVSRQAGDRRRLPVSTGSVG